MTSGLLPLLKPIAIKERVPVVLVDGGEIDLLDGAFVVVDATGSMQAGNACSRRSRG